MSNTVTNQGKTIDQITSVDTISDESKKAYFIEHGVIPVSGPQGGESSATDKETLGVPVASISTDTSNKADKVVPAAAGNLATLNATGNLADSGIAATSVITSHQDISGKADKVASATENNLAKLNSNGNLVDSGIAASAVVTDVSGKADKAVPAAAGNLATLNATGNLVDSGIAASSVITSHQDISGKADKAIPSAAGNLAKLDSTGNLVDSGVAASAVVTDVSGKADKAVPVAAGNLAKLNATGNLEDSRIVASQVVTTTDSGTDGQVLTYTDDYGVKWLNPGTPVPDAKAASNGDVLTYDTTEGIVWAAPQGGGGEAIPEHTNSNVGQALGVIGIYQYKYGTYTLIGNKIGWTQTVPIISNYLQTASLGSAGDYGFNKGIRVVIPTYDPSEESPESPKYEYGAFMNYDYGSTWPCNKNYEYWDDTGSSTIKSIKIKNHAYVHMASIDSPNTITTVNITIIRKKFEPAHALIEFANDLNTDLQLYIGQSNEWHGEDPDYQIVRPMVAAGASYTDAHKIPAKSFISVQVLGHGYFINYRPLTEQEIDNISWLNDGYVALNSDDATTFY